MPNPDTVEITTGAEPSGSVIWLHGLGADGHDFEPIIPELRLPASLSLRFVFPHAPVRPVTLNNGMAMRAWYDIFSLNRGGPVDEAGIKDSSAILEALIERETERGIDPDKIVVAGFSQGGAVALYTGLQCEQRIAGIMALSCYHPAAERIGAQAAPTDEKVRIFMAHGRTDPVVPLSLAEGTVLKLRELGYEPEWHTYPMPHSLCAEEVGDIARWLRSVLAG